MWADFFSGSNPYLHINYTGMVLNYLWIGFFLIALIVALIKTINGDAEVFSAIVNSTFESAGTSFEVALGLTGILCLWLGIMRIGEQGGAVQLLSKLVGPFFSRLFPEVPASHPARGSMLMNFSANMLGLDNAATPVGLKAMKELQEINPEKDKASNAMIMFLVLNTSGLTIIPVAVMNYRNIYGAENPADVFLPILIATFFSTLVGLIAVAIWQRINLFNPVILAYLSGMTAVIAGIIWYFSGLPPEELAIQSSILSNIILYGIICGFIVMALIRKVNVYDSFVDGAKEGFDIAIKIVPFLVAILVSIGVFRASGAMEYLISGFGWFFGLFMSSVEWVHGLPTALMKPLSGTGARGMMLESFSTHGVDSFVGKLTSTIQGSTDTTFYILAVYFGSVGIRKTRYALSAGLMADFAGITTAIIVASIWFGGGEKGLTPLETVNGFTTAWSKNEPTEANLFLSEECYIIDETMDTLAKDREEIQLMTENDSIAGYRLELISVTESNEEVEMQDQTKGKLVYFKMRRTLSDLWSDYGYECTVCNGKIVRIRNLGIMTY